MYRIISNDKKADIYLHSVLINGEYSQNAIDLIKDLNNLHCRKINFHINRKAALIFDEPGMYKCLSSHPAKIKVYIESN